MISYNYVYNFEKDILQQLTILYIYIGKPVMEPLLTTSWTTTAPTVAIVATTSWTTTTTTSLELTTQWTYSTTTTPAEVSTTRLKGKTTIAAVTTVVTVVGVAISVVCISTVLLIIRRNRRRRNRKGHIQGEYVNWGAGASQPSRTNGPIFDGQGGRCTYRNTQLLILRTLVQVYVLPY